VRYFCEWAFREAGIELDWQGENENEKGICKVTGNVLLEVDPNYYRPAEVETLLGDPTKAKTQLGWDPSRTSIEGLVKIMMEHDLNYVVRFKDRDSLAKYE
jgi:GDPmannose 4,6-dehydratase